MTERTDERIEFTGKVTALEILKFLQRNARNQFSLPSNIKDIIASPGTTKPAKGKYEDL